MDVGTYSFPACLLRPKKLNNAKVKVIVCFRKHVYHRELINLLAPTTFQICHTLYRVQIMSRMSFYVWIFKEYFFIHQTQSHNFHTYASVQAQAFHICILTYALYSRSKPRIQKMHLITVKDIRPEKNKNIEL